MQRWSYHSNKLLWRSASVNSEENNVVILGGADDFQQTQIVTHHQDNTIETQEGISFSSVANELSAEEEKQKEDGRFSIDWVYFSPTWQITNNSSVESIPVGSPVLFLVRRAPQFRVRYLLIRLHYPFGRRLMEGRKTTNLDSEG